MSYFFNHRTVFSLVTFQHKHRYKPNFNLSEQSLAFGTIFLPYQRHFYYVPVPIRAGLAVPDWIERSFMLLLPAPGAHTAKKSQSQRHCRVPWLASRQRPPRFREASRVDRPGPTTHPRLHALALPLAVWPPAPGKFCPGDRPGPSRGKR